MKLYLNQASPYARLIRVLLIETGLDNETEMIFVDPWEPPDELLIANASQFHSGRQLAAWLGLVPRQHSSGGKEKLGRISKRGDGYLRKLLVHGARTVLLWSRRKKENRSAWLEALLARRPTNVVLVAMANKTARVVWVLLSRSETFRTEPHTAT
jgi:Transposase IS116/IS110/IS902 family